MSKFLKNSKGFTPIVDFDEVLIKSKRSKEPSSKFTTGFTLIELLVVVAIIGILSSVVITSLNSAREKGKISSIKSTLKQLYNQAAINQVTKGSFAGSNVSYDDLTCTGLKEDGTQGDATTGNLAKIVQPLIDQGIVVKCFSYTNSTLNDVFKRFGATALIYDEGELKAWSVDENGVVKWDTQGVDSSGNFTDPDKTAISRNQAQDYCLLSQGKLPSIEQLRTFYWSYYFGAGAVVTPFVPDGFVDGFYWSSTQVPSIPLRNYVQYTHDGRLSHGSANYYVRCVR